MIITVHTDGGARGNPGPAAIGVVITQSEPAKTIKEFGKSIGETTNNVAEYTAVIEALTVLKTLPLHSNDIVQFFLDSTLVVNQLNGLFKVKDMKLRDLLLQVRMGERELGREVRYRAVRREQNTRADYQVNKALDSLM